MLLKWRQCSRQAGVLSRAVQRLHRAALPCARCLVIKHTHVHVCEAPCLRLPCVCLRRPLVCLPHRLVLRCVDQTAGSAWRHRHHGWPQSQQCPAVHTHTHTHPSASGTCPSFERSGLLRVWRRSARPPPPQCLLPAAVHVCSRPHTNHFAHLYTPPHTPQHTSLSRAHRTPESAHTFFPPYLADRPSHAHEVLLCRLAVNEMMDGPAAAEPKQQASDPTAAAEAGMGAVRASLPGCACCWLMMIPCA